MALLLGPDCDSAGSVKKDLHPLLAPLKFLTACTVTIHSSARDRDYVDVALHSEAGVFLAFQIDCLNVFFLMRLSFTIVCGCSSNALLVQRRYYPHSMLLLNPASLIIT